MSVLPFLREPTPARTAALEALEQALESPERDLWRTFVSQLERGLRRAALATLDRLVAAVEAYHDERRAAWVMAVWRARWDTGALERLPFPLVDRLIVPELRRGYAAKLPSYARWLRHTRQWRRVLAATSALLQVTPADAAQRWPYRAFRAEARLALGQSAAAQADLDALARSPHAIWQDRARRLRANIRTVGPSRQS